ncbi:MAG: alanine--glyoxylate aminotransferase family protein [Candidatus Dadabacteria bacterium]|nr:alanine--glyoxylate aminotransferase family protein [Candidatus Dadabacteria bacterium]
MARSQIKKLAPPERILLGPGPSNVSKAVYDALSTPIIGHLDPDFLAMMDEIGGMLREVFQTKNRLTIPMSGTGSSGMETAFVNVIEPGDTVIIGVNGVFGERMCDVAARCGAKAVRVEAPWGDIIEPDAFISALKKNPGAKAAALVHAETSTGARQPLEEAGKYLSGTETLFLVDAVTSLAGCDLRIDEWGVDICYSGTQKCLSVPPGISPVTFSEKAERALAAKKSKVQSWYLDLGMICKYWGSERVYHHTAPVSMLFALREGLRVILEEGLANRFERHGRLGAELAEKLGAMGFKPFAREGYRLPMLASVFLPEGMDDAEARRALLEEHGIEVGPGLGETRGKIWRVGLMGESCKAENIDALTRAISRMTGAAV